MRNVSKTQDSSDKKELKNSNNKLNKDNYDSTPIQHYTLKKCPYLKTSTLPCYTYSNTNKLLVSPSNLITNKYQYVIALGKEKISSVLLETTQQLLRGLEGLEKQKLDKATRYIMPST